MIKYKTIIDTPSITLNLMGREKIFMKNQEVNDDAYTKAYPKYFKKIGEINGYGKFLATPIFTSIENDPIKDFLNKEEVRKRVKVSEIKEVIIEKIAEDIEEKIEKKFDIDINSEDIEDIIEESFEYDAKIETEE